MGNELRVIISGGGTGGHIFPAVSIANAIKQMQPDAKILFVGALGRMEMQRVPAAGYEIKGLPIQGFDRKHLLKNIKVLYKIWKSQRMARKIIRDFRPQVAVGVGGYASLRFVWLMRVWSDSSLQTRLCLRVILSASNCLIPPSPRQMLCGRSA